MSGKTFKTLVLYWSSGGNTRRVAFALRDTLSELSVCQETLPNESDLKAVSGRLKGLLKRLEGQLSRTV